jgi:hypothetical protein
MKPDAAGGFHEGPVASITVRFINRSRGFRTARLAAPSRL